MPNPGARTLRRFFGAVSSLQGAIFVQNAAVRSKRSPISTAAAFAFIGVSSIAEQFFSATMHSVQGVYVSSTTEGWTGRIRRLRRRLCLASHALSVMERQGFRTSRSSVSRSRITTSALFRRATGRRANCSPHQRGLAILHRNGEFDRIYRQWFGLSTPRAAGGGHRVSAAIRVLAFRAGRLLHQHLRHASSYATAVAAHTLIGTFAMAVEGARVGRTTRR